MRKLTKIVSCGIILTGCLLGLTGCGMHSINGSYTKTLNTQQYSQMPEKYRPKVVYHIKNHKIYIQSVQPHMNKLIHLQSKAFDSRVHAGEQQAEKTGQSSKIPSQSVINSTKKNGIKSEKARAKMYQVFKINHVKNLGSNYTLKGHAYAHMVGLNKKGNIQHATKKSKVMTIKIKKVGNDIQITPDAKYNSSITRGIKSESKHNIMKLLHSDHIKPSKIGY